ncbi:MAG: hypothetical protein H0V80_09780 [Acidobacteria bacterium]|nr:hypothetical protein [Acidobacteriota bacterium]
MRHEMRSGLLVCLLSASVTPVVAQTAPAPAPAVTPAATPAAAGNPLPLLVIYREEVRPGHSAAHAVNEGRWAGAYSKAGAPQTWLGMTTVAGPGEAWFLSRYASYDAFEQSEAAVEKNTGLVSETDGFSAQESDMLSRTSTIMAGYRAPLSYQPDVPLPEMRYMQVDVVKVKAGFDRDFRTAWRQIAEAHTKAKMDEHWSVYEMEAGGPDLTFFFFYPRKTLAEMDKVGPMHGADAYRDAVGENGRLAQREMAQRAIESSQTYVFRLRPAMSVLTKAWIDADPGFWTPKAPTVVAKNAPVAKK